MGDDSHQINSTLSAEVKNLVVNYLGSVDRREQITWLSAEIIAPIGLLVNFVFLFTVLRVKSMRTIINIYLSNLAVADSLFLLTDFTYALFSPIEVNNFFVQTAILSVNNMTVAASTFFVVTIAAERFSAVRDPLSHKEKASKSRAAKISAGLWVLTIIVGVILIFLPETVFSQIIFWISTILSSVCFIATLTLYIYVVVKVHYQSTQFPNQPKRAGKVLRMIIINTALFFIWNLLDIAAAIIVLIADNYLTKVPSRDVEGLQLAGNVVMLFLCAEIFRLVNSSVHPLVYSAMNAEYRAAVVEAFLFLKLCCRCCPRRNPSRPSQPGKQIELRVMPQVKNDQEHPAARPISSKPPSKSTESQQSLDGCQEQCSRQSSSKAHTHLQQHVRVHVEVHAEQAVIPQPTRSHLEHSSPQ